MSIYYNECPALEDEYNYPIIFWWYFTVLVLSMGLGSRRLEDTFREWMCDLAAALVNPLDPSSLIL